MRKKSAKISEVSRRDGESKSTGKMRRLRAAMAAGANAEPLKGLPDPLKRLHRDAAGRVPEKPKSRIRDAILEQLGKRSITRYQLWKLAREHCAKLPESAVYEFLRGQRHLGLEYLEALLAALHLAVVPSVGRHRLQKQR